MKMNAHCLPCLVNQAVKVAEMTNAPDRDALYRKIFRVLSEADFTRTNPEIIGATFRVLKEHTGNPDPYRETRAYYNELIRPLAEQFARRIDESADPPGLAVRYAIIGNIIDFNPIHGRSAGDMLRWFEGAETRPLAIDHLPQLLDDLSGAKTLLYLGDNCGEIWMDKLLLQKLRGRFPGLDIWFGTRGAPVVNDSIEEDACAVGMAEVAHVISNGDDSLGTVLPRVSAQFRAVYDRADVIIAKGQANYESLSEEAGNRYFLLMAKCDVIAGDIGVGRESLVCLHRK